MPILKVYEYYTYYEKIECANYMQIRMRFFDRLKFLFLGKKCILKYEDERATEKRRKNLEAFRKWREEQEAKESEENT